MNQLRKQELTNEEVCNPTENQLKLLLDRLRPASLLHLTCYDTRSHTIDSGWPHCLEIKSQIQLFCTI